MNESCPENRVDMEQVAWCGHLPVMRGGVSYLHLKGSPSPLPSLCRQTQDALQVAPLLSPGT